MVYFDANATTPLSAAALPALAQAQQEYWYNPSSPYPAAASVHNRLEDARTQLAQILGCEPELLVFNSGASEGAHSVFQYLAGVLGSSATVAISAIEHPCVRESAYRFFPQRVIEIPVGANGVADIRTLEEIAKGNTPVGRPGLIALMAANNETGALQPWQEALAIARANGIPFYTDAAQWLGKEAAAGLGQADFVTGCAHKFGGGKGVGFLKIGSDFTGFISQKGGAQENGHRAGTENYPAIAAMLAALQSREAQLCTQQQAWQSDRAAFEARLTQAIPGLTIHAHSAPRLANTSALQLPRHRNTRWVARLAKRGFCLSTGSACATGKAGPSHVLAAMGIAPTLAERTVRVSALWAGEAGSTHLADQKKHISPAAEALPAGEASQTDSAHWQALADAFIDVWHELNAEDNGGSHSLTSVISI